MGSKLNSESLTVESRASQTARSTRACSAETESNAEEDRVQHSCCTSERWGGFLPVQCAATPDPLAGTTRRTSPNLRDEGWLRSRRLDSPRLRPDDGAAAPEHAQRNAGCSGRYAGAAAAVVARDGHLCVSSSLPLGPGADQQECAGASDVQESALETSANGVASGYPGGLIGRKA